MIWNAYAEGKKKTFGISIKSCGHIFAKKGRRVCRPNGREDWLLFYVSKGTETFFLEQTEIAREGSFILFKPTERQDHICEYEKTAEFYYVHFTVDEGDFPFPIISSKIYNTEPGVRICEIFESILSELQLKQAYYEEICVGRLTELFGLFIRKTQKRGSVTGEHFGKIAYVVQHIHKHYSEEEDLEQYAEMCALSKYHFLRKFEEITGMTPIAYRNKLRLAHAKDMLEESPLSVNEIAAKCGFSSPSYFCDSFKREFGISPSGHRKSIGKP